MEAELVAAHLQQTRAQIRALLLLPDPATGELDDDVFPRSAVMRFALDPRRRRMAGAVLGTLGAVAGRWSALRGGIWPQVSGSLFGTPRR
jgi:hypothetical protein